MFGATSKFGIVGMAGVVILADLALTAAGPAGSLGKCHSCVEAQEPIRGSFFFNGNLAVPVGQFGDHVDLGGGGGLGGLIYLGGEGIAALRMEGAFIIYGTDSFQAPLSPTIPFVDVDVRTTNYIASAGVGPQVFLAQGALRPYIFGTVGVSYFATKTGVSGTSDFEEFASTTNFDDLSLALTAGGGLAIRLSSGQKPVSLDVSALYQRHGQTEYLTKGDLHQSRRGSWVVRPVLSETNLVTFRVGISIEVP